MNDCAFILNQLLVPVLVTALLVFTVPRPFVMTNLGTHVVTTNTLDMTHLDVFKKNQTVVNPSYLFVTTKGSRNHQ